MEVDVVPACCPHCRFPVELGISTEFELFMVCPVCQLGAPLAEFLGKWQAVRERLRKDIDNASNN